MITILFIILKLFDALLLSWWWVAVAVLADSLIREKCSCGGDIEQSYERGFEDGKNANSDDDYTDYF